MTATLRTCMSCISRRQTHPLSGLNSESSSQSPARSKIAFAVLWVFCSRRLSSCPREAGGARGVRHWRAVVGYMRWAVWVICEDGDLAAVLAQAFRQAPDRLSLYWVPIPNVQGGMSFWFTNRLAAAATVTEWRSAGFTAGK